jgi:CubicO group peptidase (beta-lactamase class C family)
MLGPASRSRANGGVWDGAQIVPRHWVEDSVKVQLRTGGTDDYGYGWWLPRDTTTDEYAAIGRGGQRIAVHRDLDMIIVTTAGGIEPGEATDLLAPAVVDLDRPLPANPAGVEKLNAALAAVRQPPEPQSVPPLPAKATEISGRTWLFAPNAKSLASVRLDFESPAGLSVEAVSDQ